LGQKETYKRQISSPLTQIACLPRSGWSLRQRHQPVRRHRDLDHRHIGGSDPQLSLFSRHPAL